FVKPCYSPVVDQKVEHYSTEYVKTVEPCDEEKEASKIRRSILILAKICAFEIIGIQSMYTMNKVCPFPSLAREEGDSTDDGPQHPFFNRLLIHSMTCLNGEHHCHGTHDENEGHQSYEHQRSVNVEERNSFEYFFRNWPVRLREHEFVNSAIVGQMRRADQTVGN